MGNNNDQEYFNTFGGNPVAMMVGLEVFDILKQERYLQHVADVGECFVDALWKLQSKINSWKGSKVYIGDVRGKGLFIGIEMVRNLKTKEPAGRETEQIVNRLAQEPYRLLLSIDGPHHN